MESRNNCTIKVQVCPYWSDSTKSCLVNKEGLYLPVSEHIHTYCRTSNYPSCPQFEQQGTALQENQNGSGKVADRRECIVVDRREIRETDRRGSVRISGSYSLQLAGLQKDGHTTSLLDKQATTVDLSLGGIRLQTHCELPVNSMVSFSMNGDSGGPPVQGIGQIRWCRPVEDTSVYHAGIVFTESSTSGAMRRYLGISLS